MTTNDMRSKMMSRTLHMLHKNTKIALAGVMSISLMMQPILVQAQGVTADPNAGANNTPTIGAAPNGVPLVDIATPNGAGLSHNKYHDFNVANPGLILNNHNGEVGTSQLGGVVPGNPNLRQSGSASVILNEVTSGNRTALEGPTEVFGRKADVIIANPNGITCNGCGFINTPRATLTTGIPQIGLDGSLAGFDVRGGDVTIGERGANLASGKGSVDIFDIVSRTVHLDGAVAGHDIGITAGAGKFDYASREMKELYDIAGKPEYAIDGSALGALQGDRIKLIATEKGVGVRMRNDMAANAGQLTLSADGKISINNASGRDGVKVASRSKTVTAKKITSKKNVEIKANEGITIETIGADGDLMVDSGAGLLSVEGDAIAGGKLGFKSGDTIKAGQVASGSDMDIQSTNGIDVLVAIADGQADLQTANGDINVKNGVKAGGGDLTITANKGSINSATLISFNNMTLQAGQDLNIVGNIISYGDFMVTSAKSVEYDRLFAHKNATINSYDTLFNASLVGQTATFKGNYVEGNSIIAGIDFDASQKSVDGSMHLHQDGKIIINVNDEVNAGALISSGDITIDAINDIYYDDLRAYGSADLTSTQGEISYTNSTIAAGDITFSAQNLDFKNDRAKVEASGTLTLNAKTIDVSNSTMVYGGITLNASNSLIVTNVGMMAVNANGGSGNIKITVPNFIADEKAEIVASNDLYIDATTITNAGQLAASHNFLLKAKGDLTNSASGLMYAGNNGYVLVNGNAVNSFGAIMAKNDLYFSNYNGDGKSLSLTNKAGLIQSGQDLLIQTKTLTNEANSVPTVYKTHGENHFGFNLPAKYDQLGAYGYGNTLFYDSKYGTYGAGRKKKKDGGLLHGDKNEYRVKLPLYSSKEEAFSSITLPNGDYYRADNWVFRDQKHSGRITRWDLNQNASMGYNVDTEYFTNAPTITGLIQAGNDMNLEVDTLNNSFSDIEAGNDITIVAGTINNLGISRNKYEYVTCNAAASNCMGYNADGTRNASKDIAKGQAGEVKVTALETLSSTIKAGGDLNIAATTLNNSAAEGAMTGSAKFEAVTSKGNPLSALDGMTAGGALFTPSIDLKAGNGLADQTLITPKPNSGGFGGTLPNQYFVYETRASFLDVGKFYGSAYYLTRIGYKPDRTILFMGDAYFENQLIDKQMRDLVGQGLGKGSFVPGNDAVTQMKNLLEAGADYSQNNNLKFGEPLSPEQVANLDQSIVIYVKQTLNGQEVFAPVVYIAAKDKENLTASGARLQGQDVNINVDNLTNSGLVASNANLVVKATDIVGRGGAFAADGNILLAATNSIQLNAGTTSLNGNAAILPTKAVDAGQRAVISADKNVDLNGVDVKAGESLGIYGENVNIGSQKSKTANGTDVLRGSNIEAAKDLQVKADQDINVSGSKIKAGENLAMSADKGNLVIQSEAAQSKHANSTSTTQHKSEITSGADMSLSADKNAVIAGSDVKSGGNMHIEAGESVAIIATQDKQDSRYGRLSTSTTINQASSVSAGESLGINAGKDILIGASDLKAEKNIGIQAGGDITVTAMADSYEEHSSAKKYKMNLESTTQVGSSITAGGNITAIAGQDGEAHDLNIIGSSIEAGGKVGLKASNDVNILAAEDTYHKDVKQKSGKGGILGKKKSSQSSTDAEFSVGSHISGDDGVTIISENNTTIAGSSLIAGTEDKKADINIKAGSNIIISSVTENVATSSSKSSKGFMSSSSKKNTSYDEFTVSSNLGASGDINLNAGDHIAIAGSNIHAVNDVNMEGSSVSIIGAQENHAASSSKSKSGWGVGSGDGFYSIYGKEGKKQNVEATINVGSEISAGHDVNITARDTDVNIVGSNVTAQNDINLDAARNINILPGKESHSQSETKTKSGIGVQVSHSETGASIGLGYNKTKDSKSGDASTNAKSGLRAGNDVNMKAGNDVNIQASDVSAMRDVNIHAENDVNLLAANDVTNYKEVHEKLFAGITLSVESGTLQGIQSINNAIDNFNKAGTDKNGLLNITAGVINGTNAYGKLNGAYQDSKYFIGKGGTYENEKAGFFDPLKDQYNKMNGASIFEKGNFISGSLTVGFNKLKTENSMSTSTPVVTTIEGGRSVNIEAEKGDITGVGVQIAAGTNQIWDVVDDDKAGDITLTAGKNINLISAQATQNTKGKTSSSGLSVGIDQTTMPTMSGHYSKGNSKGDSTTHVNSHILATGDVTLKSGNDTNLKGAVVSGDSVKAEIGGNLNIESLQDTAKTHSRSDTVSLTVGKNNVGGGWQYNKSKSDFASVGEQSGIKAGDGGFDITVKGNTDLKGAVISSTADPKNNTLDTGTLTTSDIENYAEASAETGGIVLPYGALSQGKYGIGKTIIGNLSNSAKADESNDSMTKSAISEGTIVIRDDNKQIDLTGQDASQTIAMLNRDTNNAHTPIEKIDVAKLEKQVAEEVALKQMIFNELIKYSDDAYDTMFNKDHPLMVLVRDKDGNIEIDETKPGQIPKMRPATPEEIENMKASPDGIIRLSANGIFNDIDGAAKYANQHAGQNDGPIYFQFFPKTDSFLAELMVASYQKVLENEFWGMTKSGEAIQGILEKYGKSGLDIYAHSRGAMTVYNAMATLNKQGNEGVLSGTDIHYFGPAANAQQTANLLNRLSDGAKDSMTLQLHKWDFVGRTIGGNPATMFTVPPGSNPIKEWINMFTGDYSIHSCYGSGQPGCGGDYGSSKTITIKAR
ncbi:filamentous hemagglutinin [Bartonella choladocola]|uniref:Filamentous hemagglutinin n=2 Tax=Bartonella choladocola TaxID=2750995 RepID=A0A1U9MJY6_9HYPH|nr:hemagglutinin repeat-containing protein [Bartonella choladocola]AQT47961.1 filamentous hemagglutinin [Bartonella choladocola]